jgi:hypothetical protein
VTTCDRTKAPEGWYCTRELGHDGPCAAMQVTGYSHCSHGISYKAPCHACDVISAQNTIATLGPIVDAARALVGEK